MDIIHLVFILFMSECNKLIRVYYCFPKVFQKETYSQKKSVWLQGFRLKYTFGNSKSLSLLQHNIEIFKDPQL